jgi:glycosyltransferase involved in cell wall biosynthesis
VHVLWMSDSPDSPTGFGNVTRFVCSGLADLGHRVSILGWQTKGTPIVWHSCQLYPTGYSDVGADVLLFYLQRLRPDILITLGNVWWLSWITHPLIATSGVPWWLYYPLDGDCGEGRLPESWVQVLRRVDLPVAMSRYGLEVTARNGVASAYIPHGVDTGLFRPPAVKSEAKAAFGYRERFVILSDARNQARKLLPRTLEIFRRFAAGKPCTGPRL